MKARTLTAAATALAVLGLAAASSLAQDIRIGYIDSIRIFKENRETQEAERQYRQDVDRWTAEKRRREQEILKLREELQAQSLMLSEEKKQEKQLELERLTQDYERFMDETFGDDGLAARRNKELTQPIVEKINRILEEIAKERGLVLVFDLANANLVYADKSLDLTDVVLTRLNQKQ